MVVSYKICQHNSFKDYIDIFKITSGRRDEKQQTRDSL